MHTAVLVALLLAGQAPAEPPTAGPAALDDALARLESWADPKRPLPDDATLRELLQVSDLRLPSLRERANTLRLELASFLAAGDAAPDAGAPASDAALGAPSSLEERRVRARLALVKRIVAMELARAEGLQQQRLDEQRAARMRAESEARRAEEAQQRALERSRSARSALLERAYARVAEIEGLKARTANERARLHEETTSILDDVRAAGEDAASVRSVARTMKQQSGEADALLGEVTKKQRALLDGVGDALLARDAVPLGIAEVSETRHAALEDAAQLGGALGSDERSDVEQAMTALRDTVTSLDTELETLREETSERWYRVAERRLEVATLLNGARLALLKQVTDDMRSRLHGLSDEGAENLDVALRQVWWMVRFHVVRRVYDAQHLEERLADPIQLGKVVWAFGLAVFALIVSLWLWRRAPSLWERTKKGALKSTQSPAYARFVGSWLSFVDAAAPRAFLIALALWLYDVLTPVAPEPELTIAVRILVWILTYQLASRLVHMLILRLARRRVSLTVVKKLRILRSVRLSLRYGFVVAYILDVMSLLVGHGVLFAAVRVAAFLGAIPILGVLVQRWREDIVSAYLAKQPSSRLARAVERASGEWYGFFVAVAAFGVVAAQGVVVLGRDFVLGFEQSRKALAYLFRLRIERQAQKRGLSPVDVSELPESVRAAFVDAPTDDNSLLVDRFAAIEDAALAIRRYPEGHGALLVHAPWGMGRTTWLMRLESEIDGEKPVLWWTPKRRVTTVEGLYHAFGDLLGMDEAPGSLREVAARLAADGPRVVFIDGIEQLFLRCLEGYIAIQTLMELIDRTRGDVFWVMSAPTPTFRHLSQTRGFEQHLGHVVFLPRWSESEIRDLIQRRQRRSGIDASFEDLIVHDVEGDKLPAQVVETEEGYIRLLWNFAEGNPRVAQLFWLRSLYKTASGQLRVRLYAAPSSDDLEGLSERERFLLSAIHLHGALTPDEAARACRLPEPAMHAHVARGVALGLYAPPHEGRQAYAITLPWWEAALRYLRRKNMLM